jgi:hypothetical protein
MKNSVIVLATVFSALSAAGALASPAEDCFNAAKGVADWDEPSISATCEQARPGFADCYAIARTVIDWSDASQIQNCVTAGAGFETCFDAQTEADRDTGEKIQSCVGGP